MKKASLVLLLTIISLPALAEEVAGAASYGNAGLIAIAAAFAIGIAALGGALGQAKVGSAAMEGLARNPNAYKDMFVPMIIGLVLIESLVIYGFVISFMLVGKI